MMEFLKISTGKILAGLLLIGATVFAIVTILAYFPNKMPAPGKGDDAWYSGVRYKMTLVECVDSTSQKEKNDTILNALTKRVAIIKGKIKDSTNRIQDSTDLKVAMDSLVVAERSSQQMTQATALQCGDQKQIHLNRILLILVAAMGFLGNMVHIASSFTSFVGNGTFEPKWILWYFVRPFTAAALAVLVYFVIRAGFMGSGSDASSINLYGLLSLSALAGLFTDNATLKLKEVFDVIFKPKDERSGKLTDFKTKVVSVTPAKIDVTKSNKISIKGELLNKKKLIVEIEGKAVRNLPATETSIDFEYTVDASDRDKSSFTILVKDESGKEVYYNQQHDKA